MILKVSNMVELFKSSIFWWKVGSERWKASSFHVPRFSFHVIVG